MDASKDYRKHPQRLPASIHLSPNITIKSIEQHKNEAHNQSKGLCIKTQYLLSTTPKRFLQFTTHQTSFSNMTLHPMNCFYEEAHNQSKGLCIKTQYLLSTTPKRFLQFTTHQTSFSNMSLHPMNCFYEEAHNQSKDFCNVTLQSSALSIMILHSMNCFMKRHTTNQKVCAIRYTSNFHLIHYDSPLHELFL
ncbi:uncharacterized protein LOC113047932 isoform X5 [Carassius auratus]|uniref:Uncharacterized protein LOC113047932 isoform X5 n=1 Tax=Carassius auratus TaxID=7957 RepID=A0A6P6JZ88_CARAU|nr:uncharacterized protein LOC113047932 isoform X5 [Carassius auratus]XP_026065154.1 uncharacterized protein LOC113047932 isoform X5 [Carassius auratus]